MGGPGGCRSKLPLEWPESAQGLGSEHGAKAQAVGTALDLLGDIDCQGWLAPAPLVPYLERALRCQKTL